MSVSLNLSVSRRHTAQRCTSSGLSATRDSRIVRQPWTQGALDGRSLTAAWGFW